MRRNILTLLLAMMMPWYPLYVYSQRERILMDEGWLFALGSASSPEKDFGCGTEDFNYLTKANSVHNKGPYSKDFDDSEWEKVDLPHDWAVHLPYDRNAIHSHGYKMLGYKYPGNSVGWYRRIINIPETDLGRHLFSGIQKYGSTDSI